MTVGKDGTLDGPRLTKSRRQVTRDFRNHCHACTVPCPVVTLCSSGQGTTSDLSFYLKMLRRRSASLLFWVKFICRAEDSSSCVMVGMCTGTSFAFCSSAAYTHRSTNRFFFSNGVSFFQCPGSHGDVFTVICVMVHKGLDSAGPSEEVSLMNTHSSKKRFSRPLRLGSALQTF